MKYVTWHDIHTPVSPYATFKGAFYDLSVILDYTNKWI